MSTSSNHSFTEPMFERIVTIQRKGGLLNQEAENESHIGLTMGC